MNFKKIMNIITVVNIGQNLFSHSKSIDWRGYSFSSFQIPLTWECLTRQASHRLDLKASCGKPSWHLLVQVARPACTYWLILPEVKKKIKISMKFKNK